MKTKIAAVVTTAALAGTVLIATATPALAHGGHYCGKRSHLTAPFVREKYTGRVVRPGKDTHFYDVEVLNFMGWAPVHDFRRRC